jgi:ribonuclease-3
MKQIEQCNQLSSRIGYSFKNAELLKRALTHRSIPGKNNERLEFLGDAVLSFIISTELHQRHPRAREGELSRMRSALVNGEILAEFARDLEVGTYLRLGVGELKSGGQNRDSILADALEAIIGAIFLDGGIEICRSSVLNWYDERFEDLSALKPKKDAKSLLQEWLQARKFPLPHYEATTTGAAHAQTFYVTCQIEGLPHQTKGASTSRRKAEQEAAANYLELIKNEK